MKKQRTSTVFLLFSVLSISSVLPGRADTWVTVNPDGSVTHTTVTASSGPATNIPARNYAPGQPLPAAPSQTRNNVSSYAYSANSYPSTGYYYPQPSYPQPYYPQPYYPPATTNYNQYYYYPPTQAYSGPIHPVPSYVFPPWVTSIPLGSSYGYYYPPAYGHPCAICSGYPCRCYRGSSSSFSIGPGGVSITIKNGRQRTYTRHRR